MLTNSNTFNGSCIISDFEKKRILTLMGEGREIMEIASVKIYTIGKKMNCWLYSDIEGFLCYVIDLIEKSIYFIVYDYISHEKLLQFELYENFSKYYTVLEVDFHCFETECGFIGLNFTDKEDATVFQKRIKKNDSKSLTELFKISYTSIRRRSNIYNKQKKELIFLIKEILLNNGVFVNSPIDDLFDSIDIFKPKYFEMLKNITFDRVNKIFKIDKMSQKMVTLCRSYGVKKSDFKNESLGLNIFKSISLDNDQYQMNKINKFKLFKIESNVFMEIVEVSIKVDNEESQINHDEKSDNNTKSQPQSNSGNSEKDSNEDNNTKKLSKLEIAAKQRWDAINKNNVYLSNSSSSSDGYND